MRGGPKGAERLGDARMLVPLEGPAPSLATYSLFPPPFCRGTLPGVDRPFSPIPFYSGTPTPGRHPPFFLGPPRRGCVVRPITRALSHALIFGPAGRHRLPAPTHPPFPKTPTFRA